MQKPMLKKRPIFKVHQEVVLIRESIKGDVVCESRSVRIKKGQQGVVLLVCRVPEISSIGYAVEFFDKNGNSVAVSTVEEEDLAALPGGYPDVKAMKPHRKNKSKARAA